MDRRQKKTRAAIFAAFRALLTEKSYGKITVQDIIDRADVGRTTFYTHFETKEDLLKALCEELFGHIVDSALDSANTRGLYSDKAAPASVFCHLLQHLRENDGIAGLREQRDIPAVFPGQPEQADRDPACQSRPCNQSVNSAGFSHQPHLRKLCGDGALVD